jgi:hypothetical protein
MGTQVYLTLPERVLYGFYRLIGADFAEFVDCVLD